MPARNDAAAKQARQERAESRQATAVTEQARVYVIVAPKLRQSSAWPRLRAALRAKAKNARLVAYEDVFPDGDYEQTWQDRLGQLSGAVVVPARKARFQWLGEQAAREATYLAGLGKPVLLFSRDGLVPWPSVRLERPDSYPHGLPFQVAPGQADAGVRGGPDGSPAGEQSP